VWNGGKPPAKNSITEDDSLILIYAPPWEFPFYVILALVGPKSIIYAKKIQLE